jgi:hypothetical protein
MNERHTPTTRHQPSLKAANDCVPVLSTLPCNLGGKSIVSFAEGVGGVEISTHSTALLRGIFWIMDVLCQLRREHNDNRTQNRCGSLKWWEVACAEHDMAWLVAQTDRYSGSDLRALCHEAAMGPVREHGARIANVPVSALRPVQQKDFVTALGTIKPSVNTQQMAGIEAWANEFGTKT